MFWSGLQGLWPKRRNGGKHATEKAVGSQDGQKRRLGHMTMRAPFLVMLVCGLAACQPKVPESGPGVGFADYNSFLRSRTANPVPSQDFGAASTPAAPTEFSTAIASSAIDAAEAGTTTAGVGAPLDPMALAGGERARGNAPAGIQETTAEMGFVTAGVSDEQDFAAVKSRETIESDKARIEANRAQYVVIEPGALPVRSGDAGPNIAEYAIATNNPVGVPLYDRPSIYLVNVKVACTKFTSPDLAQEAFLAAGGPQGDRKGLDPDGDGFACDWDPRPFRAALQ
jgi:hypothetical protein